MFPPRGGGGDPVCLHMHVDVRAQDDSWKKPVFRGTITWCEMGKQNMQAKKVYSLALKTIRPMLFCRLLSVKKGIIVKRQWLHIRNPSLTKITSLIVMFTVLLSVKCHQANRLKSGRNNSCKWYLRANSLTCITSLKMLFMKQCH